MNPWQNTSAIVGLVLDFRWCLCLPPRSLQKFSKWCRPSRTPCSVRWRCASTKMVARTTGRLHETMIRRLGGRLVFPATVEPGPGGVASPGCHKLLGFGGWVFSHFHGVQVFSTSSYWGFKHPIFSGRHFWRALDGFLPKVFASRLIRLEFHLKHV